MEGSHDHTTQSNITLLKATERGHSNYGWLDSYHSFSFSDYHDPDRTGFGVLRVINEDVVQPGKGFATHGHRDMEILSYVLEGALAHKDSMGNGSIIRPGEIQRMSAGTGISHSEFNYSKTEPVHFLQIWLLPEREGIRPSYQQKYYDDEEISGRLRLVASRDGREGSITIYQHAELYASRLHAGQAVSHPLALGRSVYIHAARGDILINGTALNAGDGAKITWEGLIHITTPNDGELLLFDLPEN